MPFSIDAKRSSRKARKIIAIHQNKFSKAYVSTIDNSRRPLDSLSDMTNMELVQDNIVRPRPPLVQYGTQPANPIIGRGNIRYGGNRSLLFMQNVASVGKIYIQTDGGVFTLIGGTYSSTAWAGFVQSKNKVYVWNGVDNLSYVDLTDNTIHTYSALATPVITSVVKTGLAGTAFTQYYRVSANNDVGESIASVVGSVTILKPRDQWILNTDYIDVTWGAVAGASSYTVYTGDSATITEELVTVNAVTYKDDGSVFPNIYNLAPEGNSTQGAVFTWMYNDAKSSQLYGITSDNKLYYSAPLTASADFSTGNGGGFVTIDEGGDTQLNYVTGFRTGKGDPIVTVSSRGAAGKGRISHVTFDSTTIGDQFISFPNIFEANGQSGTYSARGTIKARDSLFYFTGQDVRSTGTSQNIVNILTTNTISQVIEPDLANVSLAYLDKSVGVEYKDKLYWALPVNGTSNNEVWCLDLSRKNAWILRWPIAVMDLWLYEDNAGTPHFCALVGNVILEFTRAGASTHNDNGVAWSSRVAFSSMVWDEDGITLGSIRNQYFKFLQPKGDIRVNATGLTRRGVQVSAGSDTFTVTTTFTGIGSWDYSGDYKYGDDFSGGIQSFGKSVSVLRIKPKGLLNQLDWEVLASTSGSDYSLSSVNTRGWSIDDLVLKI